jgi:hypothetical protein
MIDGFTDEAVLVFEGAPVGPFIGRSAIAEAYRSQPPDDEIDILRVSEADATIEALYGWHRDMGLPAGRMIISPSRRADFSARRDVRADLTVRAEILLIRRFRVRGRLSP